MLQETGLSDLEFRSEQPMTDRAYAHIRDQIVSFALQPGEILSESTLSRALEMSRTPVREALRRLQGEGLVTLDMRLGARVTDVSVDDVDHAYRVLEVLEGLAARLAAECDHSPGLAELETIGSRLSESESAADLVGWAAADVELHRKIWEIAGNSILLRQLESIYPLIERIRHIHLREEVNSPRLAQETAQHVAVITAIRERDGATAERLMRELFHRARVDNVRLLRTWIAPLRSRF